MRTQLIRLEGLVRAWRVQVLGKCCLLLALATCIGGHGGPLSTPGGIWGAIKGGLFWNAETMISRPATSYVTLLSLRALS